MAAESRRTTAKSGYLDSGRANRHLEFMGATLTLGKLIGPIATATILNAFWFAAIWRGHQHQQRNGKMPLRFDLALAGYIAANCAAVYATRGRPLTSGTDLFLTAFLSEAFGIVVVYGLVYSFVLSRGRPWSERAVPMASAVFLSGLAILVTVTA